jgi:glycosyltransferase involved in cell wall biosynthesis
MVEAPTVSVVVPTHNRAPMLARLLDALADVDRPAGGFEVIVVDDGSVDDTAERAAASGAKVIHRDDAGGAAGGSKAHAMEAGVAASDAPALLFVDADLLGLTSDHLEQVCRPFLDGTATMSVGWFDYGAWNPLVLRLPPTTGERVVPRWVFEAIPPEKRDGYTIEIMINEVIAEGRLPTTARIMRGVTHRTKRQKLGRLEGYRRTWEMFWTLLSVPITGVVRWRTYWFYLRGLTVES